jgi:hypothetical protein
MTWKDVGGNLDSRVGSLAERLNRRLSRRAALRAGVVGSVAGVAAVALGESPAAAYTYSPGCGPTRDCSGCGYPDGCPSGYVLCKISSLCGTPPSHGGSGGGVANSQGHWCEWPGGIWESARNLGHGNGYTLCYDCVQSPINTTHCHSWCVCPSACICCNCTTAEDVRREMKRLGLSIQQTPVRSNP